MDGAQEAFIEFTFPATRDTIQQLLTVSSAALIFSVTFCEKIINATTAKRGQLQGMLGAWIRLAGLDHPW
jgi:hypothetical protein